MNSKAGVLNKCGTFWQRLSVGLLGFVCLSLAGCSVESLREPSRGRVFTAARQYLPADRIPPEGVAAYGLVAFTAMPTDASRERLRRVCQAFDATLPDVVDLPGSVDRFDLMVSVWPLRRWAQADVDRDPCGFFTSNYDLAAGLSAINAASAQGARLRGRGPFLIGWSPSSSRGAPDQAVLVVDLSQFDTQAGMDAMFLFWRYQITENPTLWRSGFSAERLRIVIREYADRYGADIMSAVRLASAKP